MRTVLVSIDERSELPIKEAIEDMYAPHDDIKFIFFSVSLFGDEGALEPYRDWAASTGVDAEFVSRGLQAMSQMAVNDEAGMLTVRYGKERDVDEIVVPKDGAGSMRKLLYGSTEAYLTENSMWPVVVIPSDVLEVEDGVAGQYAGHLNK